MILNPLQSIYPKYNFKFGLNIVEIVSYIYIVVEFASLFFKQTPNLYLFYAVFRTFLVQ